MNRQLGISLWTRRTSSVLRQNHFDYEDERAIDVVIMGNEKLYNIMKKKDAIYMKEDFQMKMVFAQLNLKENSLN